MTYGQLRLRLSKLLPGIDLELIDGWIQDRYSEILDVLPWKRQEAESVIQAPQSYATGTLDATQGSATVTGSGTVWTSAMNGLMIRINNTSEYYQFTQVSGTSGTLDRPFEGPTATGLAYRIDQAVYLLPSNCRIVKQVRPLHNRTIPLKMATPGDLNRISSDRNFYGTPEYWAQTWDSFSDPPQLQLELFPVPDCPDTGTNILSWAVQYVFDASELDAEQTSTSLLPFVRPAALIEGVQADALRPRPGYDGNLTAAQDHENRFSDLLNTMAKVNAQQRGPQPLRLAPELKRQVPPRYPFGPRHRGFTG